jgi:hypothetical protein
MLDSVQGNVLGASMDESMQALNQEIAKPLPGSKRVTESVAEDEMAIFMKAQAQTR